MIDQFQLKKRFVLLCQQAVENAVSLPLRQRIQRVADADLEILLRRQRFAACKDLFGVKIIDYCVRTGSACIDSLSTERRSLVLLSHSIYKGHTRPSPK